MNKEDYLVHYGVLGMKWGVRKDGKPQGYQGSSRHERSTKRQQRRQIKQRAKAERYRKKMEERYGKESSISTLVNNRIERDKKVYKRDVRYMSDKELKTAITRLENEKKYKTLSRPNDTILDGVKNMVSSFMSEHGDAVVAGSAAVVTTAVLNRRAIRTGARVVGYLM